MSKPVGNRPMALSPRLRNFLADTSALVVFFTLTSGLNERFVAGMAWEDVATARLIGAPLMVLTARPYGIWRSWFLGRFALRTRRAKLCADAFALLAFQVPIYLAIILVGGADLQNALYGTAGFAVLVLILGRPYGLWLDFVRRRFGLDGPGQKPMSLGG